MPASRVAEAAYMAALAAIPDGPAKTQGIALGQAAAAATLAKRANDNVDDGTIPEQGLSAAGEPGKYQCTPGFPFIAFEKWANVTPFVLQDNTQFRPGPPYAVTDAKFKADLDEVKKLGGDGKTTPSARTDDQTQIALFWLESSPLKWSRIARTVATDKGLDLWQSARLFAILDMALADGYVAMSASKNHYNFWRPVTAIQQRWGHDLDAIASRHRRIRTILRVIPSKVAWGPRCSSNCLAPIRSASRTVARRCLPEAHATTEASAALLYQLLPGSGRECLFARPRWLPLPQRHRRRNRIWAQDWRACRHAPATGEVKGDETAVALGGCHFRRYEGCGARRTDPPRLGAAVGLARCRAPRDDRMSARAGAVVRPCRAQDACALDPSANGSRRYLRRDPRHGRDVRVGSIRSAAQLDRSVTAIAACSVGRDVADFVTGATNRERRLSTLSCYCPSYSVPNPFRNRP